MAEAAKNKSESRFKKKLLLIIGVLVLLALAGVSIYFFLQYQYNQKLLQNPSLASQTETRNLLDRVGKLIVLPSDEQPSIATVSDVTKLKNQSFFANAKNGDKVLIYTKAKKAILYDPSANKIIEVSVLNLEQPTPSTPKPLNVTIYNGTTVVGFTTTVEKQLKDKAANVVVVDKANASKSTYTKTLVIDLTGKQALAAKELAKLINGEVASLPAGEIKPKDADLLVILGK